MLKRFLYVALFACLCYSCSQKEVKQGSVTYNIEYELPDTLKKFIDYLPKAAIVYFKGDSTVSIQQTGEESTTVITYKPTELMRVLLKSSSKKYVIDYTKAEQPEILPATNGYVYTKSKETKIIAGHKASKYELTDKATGVSSEAWFTKEVSVAPNFLTTVFDTTYGVPLTFITKQNNMPVKFTVKQIKFEPVPPAVFSTPAGYQKLTPTQFREMPVEN